MVESEKDIRWVQRFSNYKKALAQLDKFIRKGLLSELEEQGLIKSFEYTYELAWNTLKDYLVYQGRTGIVGSRDTFRVAFSEELIPDGERWMDMLQSRNRTSHTYDLKTAKEISNEIFNVYHPLFHELKERFDEISIKSGLS